MPRPKFIFGFAQPLLLTCLVLLLLHSTPSHANFIQRLFSGGARVGAERSEQKLERLTRQGQREKAISVCQVLLEIPSITIPMLLQAQLIAEIAPRVYAFEGSPMHDHEMLSLQRFAEVMKGDVLAAGGLLYMSGVPAVDGVFFPDDGGAPVNVSVKTSMGDRENGMNFVKYKIRDAEQSLEKHYSYNGMASGLGLSVNAQGQLDGSGKAHRTYKEAMAKAITRIFAIEYSSVRPATVFLDLSTEPRQQPQFLVAHDLDSSLLAVETTRSDDVLLRVLDARIRDDEIERPLLVNLSHKVRRLEQNRHLDQYVILFHRSVLQVGRFGIRHTELRQTELRRTGIEQAETEIKKK